MIHGTETEPEARRAYEFFVDRDVQQVGFVPHPTINMAGASPDGLVGDDGLLELKCPNTATHIETLLTGMHPRQIFKQMQFQMACTGGSGATSPATTTGFPSGCGCSSSASRRTWLLLDSKPAGQNGDAPRQPVPAGAAFDTDLDDDVPFITCDPALEYRVR
jgi:hypothetical protein